MPSKKSLRPASKRTRSRAPRRAVKAVSKQKQIAADLRAGIACLCPPDEVMQLGFNSCFPRVAVRRALGILPLDDLDNPRAVAATDAFESAFEMGENPDRMHYFSAFNQQQYTECIVALELAAILVEEGGVE